MKLVDNLKYWYAHWKAYQYIAKKYHCWKFRFLFHDIDKPFAKIFLPSKIVSKIHRKLHRHHAEYIFPKRRDYLGMVIDWECAKLTKPNKQLNAEETLNKYYPDLSDKIYPIIRKLNINKINNYENRRSNNDVD